MIEPLKHSVDLDENVNLRARDRNRVHAAVHNSAHERTASSCSRRMTFNTLAIAGILLIFTALMIASAGAAGRARTVNFNGGAHVIVPSGSTDTLRTPVSFVDLVVGNPAIADVTPLTDKSFVVHGKKMGTTTISAYDAAKQLVGTIEIEVGMNAGC